MADSPALRRESRPISLRSSQQSTGRYLVYFHRLEDGVTLEVDLSKCHAIVKVKDGLRQCVRNPTSTGNNLFLCSVKHTLEFGKVEEPTIFEGELIDVFRSPREVGPHRGPRRSVILGMKRTW